jgi:hypothetical protein
VAWWAFSTRNFTGFAFIVFLILKKSSGLSPSRKVDIQPLSPFGLNTVSVFLAIYLFLRRAGNNLKSYLHLHLIVFRRLGFYCGAWCFDFVRCSWFGTEWDSQYSSFWVIDIKKFPFDCQKILFQLFIAGIIALHWFTFSEPSKFPQHFDPL